MTSYEFTHFKKIVWVWKTKSRLFCLRYDPSIEFWRKNHITFIFIKTMSLDLSVQMACWYHLELFWLFLSKTAQHDPNWPSRNWGRFGLWGRFGSFHFTEPVVPGRCSMCLMNYLFQFCAVAVHAIPNSSSCQHKGLQIRYNLNSRARKVMR